jgi:hypothetical protein
MDFTITCGTEIDNACGTAFNGELESSRDMKVSASGTLIGIDGIEASTTYTTTQKKLKWWNTIKQFNKYAKL